MRNSEGRITGVIGNAREVTDERDYLQSIQKVHAQTKADLKNKEDSIKKAQETLLRLIPDELPRSNQTHFTSLFIPSEELSGDFFILRKSGYRFLILMADCCGHGIAASLNAVLLRETCERHLFVLTEGGFPSEFIKRVNNDMLTNVSNDQYHSLFVASFDETSGVITYSSAGGKCPIILDGHRSNFPPEARGLPLGFQKEAPYHDQSILISAGSRVIFFSDALTEIFDESRGEFLFRESHLQALLENRQQTSTRDLPDVILKEVSSKSGGLPLRDDLSLIIMGYRENSMGQFSGNNFKELIARAHNPLRAELFRFSWEPEKVEELWIAFQEIARNAVEHGNQNNPSRKVQVSYEAGASEIHVTISDEGQGFDPARVPDPTDLSHLQRLEKNEEVHRLTHGRGIWISRNFYLDALEYDAKGNRAKLVKRNSFAKTKVHLIDKNLTS